MVLLRKGHQDKEDSIVISSPDDDKDAKGDGLTAGASQLNTGKKSTNVERILSPSPSSATLKMTRPKQRPQLRNQKVTIFFLSKAFRRGTFTFLFVVVAAVAPVTRLPVSTSRVIPAASIKFAPTISAVTTVTGAA